MDPDRRTARVAGTLFVLATAASLMGSALESPVGTEAGYLARGAANLDRASAGVLLELIAAGASVAIAISLFPVLRRWGPGLAVGSVVFRAIEGVMYGVGAIGLVAILGVGQQLTIAASADRAALQAIGDAFLALREGAVLAGVFAFAVGASAYYAILFRSRLVPRWLSGWGIAAEVLVLAACVAALFSHNAITSYAIVMLPIAVQEMALAGWLLVRGFDPRATEPGSRRTTDERARGPRPGTLTA